MKMYLKTLAKSLVILNKKWSELAKILGRALQQQKRNFTDYRFSETKKINENYPAVSIPVPHVLTVNDLKFFDMVDYFWKSRKERTCLEEKFQKVRRILMVMQPCVHINKVSYY